MKMPRSEQIQFVRDLTASVANSTIEAIDQKRIPATWDGIELRKYLADKFAESVFPIVGPRLREYNRVMATTPNL